MHDDFVYKCFRPCPVVKSGEAIKLITALFVGRLRLHSIMAQYGCLQKISLGTAADGGSIPSGAIFCFYINLYKLLGYGNLMTDGKTALVYFYQEPFELLVLRKLRQTMSLLEVWSLSKERR